MRTILSLWLAASPQLHALQSGSAVPPQALERAGGGADDGEYFYEAEHAEAGTAERRVFKRKPGKDRCLILYHLPKCGGTSLQHFFADNGLKLWTHYGPIDRHAPPPASDRLGPTPFEGADVYMGHFMPEFKRFLRDTYGMRRNCYEATVMRFPFERVASALYYFNPNSTAEEHIATMKNGPCHFPNDELFNDACRRFSNYTSEWFDTYESAYRTLACSASCKVPFALESLRKLDFVFFTEQYQQIEGMVQEVFGLPAVSPVPTLHRSGNPGFKQLPAELQLLIAMANKADVHLYKEMVKSSAP